MSNTVTFDIAPKLLQGIVKENNFFERYSYTNKDLFKALSVTMLRRAWKPKHYKKDTQPIRTYQSTVFSLVAALSKMNPEYSSDISWNPSWNLFDSDNGSCLTIFIRNSNYEFSC